METDESDLKKAPDQPHLGFLDEHRSGIFVLIVLGFAGLAVGLYFLVR